MNQELSPNNAEPSPFWRFRYAIGLVIMGAIATYFLLSEYRAHFLGALPLLLLLSCPLVHVFMHRGHGAHGDGHAHHHGGEPTSNPSAETRTPPTGDRT